MEPQYTSCRAACHRCRPEWTYMGIRLAGLGQSRRPIKVGCPRCHAKVKLDAANAR